MGSWCCCLYMCGHTLTQLLCALAAGGRGSSRVLSITLSKAHTSDASLLEYAIWDSLLQQQPDGQQQQQQQKTSAAAAAAAAAAEDVRHKQCSGAYLDQLDEDGGDVLHSSDQLSRL